MQQSPDMSIILTIMIIMFVTLVEYSGSGLPCIFIRILTPRIQIKGDDTLSVANSRLKDSYLHSNLHIVKRLRLNIVCGINE